jgi:hypothetical protein
LVFYIIMPTCVALVHPQHNTHSIFCVRHSEGPNLVVVTPHLNDSNYLSWSQSMRCALCAKNTLKFIDRILPISDIHDLNRGLRKRYNHLIHSWSTLLKQLFSTKMPLMHGKSSNVIHYQQPETRFKICFGFSQLSSNVKLHFWASMRCAAMHDSYKLLAIIVLRIK